MCGRSTGNEYTICSSTLNCKLGTCVKTEDTIGKACGMYTYCGNSDLTCLLTNSTSGTCQKRSALGEYCYQGGDCQMAQSSDELVRCLNFSCQRVYAKPAGKSCLKDNECYGGNCKDGVCQPIVTNAGTCYLGKSCPSGSYCTCRGYTQLLGASGSCIGLDGCIGAKTDVKTCLFNLGIREFKYLIPDLDRKQVLDVDSSAVSRCKKYYNRYYSCLKKMYDGIGWTTTGLTGFDLSASTSDDDALMPSGVDGLALGMWTALLAVIVIMSL